MALLVSGLLCPSGAFAGSWSLSPTSYATTFDAFTTTSSETVTVTVPASTTVSSLTLVPSTELVWYATVSPAAGYTGIHTTTATTKDFTVDFEGLCSEDFGETLFWYGTLDAIADGVTVAAQAVELSFDPCGGLPPVAECEDVTVKADSACSACVSIDGGSYDPDEGDDITLDQDVECLTGVGSTDVELTVSDESGGTDTCTSTVTVEDHTPPVVVTKGVELWPPNHQYESLSLLSCLKVNFDNCGGTSYSAGHNGSITSISSDEVEDATGMGDGNTKNDIVISSSTTFKLRAEREGAGNGRVYTVRFNMTDESGNTTASSCKITVPHDQSGAVAVDNGMTAGYTLRR